MPVALIAVANGLANAVINETKTDNLTKEELPPAKEPSGNLLLQI